MIRVSLYMPRGFDRTRPAIPNGLWRFHLQTGSSGFRQFDRVGQGDCLCTGSGRGRVAFNYYHNESRAEATFDAFKAAGGTGVLVRADITDEEHVQQLVRQVEADLGPVDILVPNATPAQPQSPSRPTTGNYTRRCSIFSSRVRTCSAGPACRT